MCYIYALFPLAIPFFRCFSSTLPFSSGDLFKGLEGAPLDPEGFLLRLLLTLLFLLSRLDEIDFLLLFSLDDFVEDEVVESVGDCAEFRSET